MKNLLLTLLLCLPFTKIMAEVDPNFHIYLCFGQSNMEGNAQWEAVDAQYVDPRFQMLATTDFTNPQRTMGKWYTANCPIVSPAGRLGMSDYFGRVMVAAMPKDVKVGVVAVAIGGTNILMFDKDNYQEYANKDDYSGQLARQYYGGNPYKRLIDMAKIAQKSGVIKGILLHQGCTNCGDSEWPNMVKKIYNSILTDLNLKAEDVPLLAGETERQDMGGGCSSHNTVVAKLPSVIPTAHVVSSEDIPGNGTDAWHFSAAGYRTFGKRYAYEMLRAKGMDVKVNADYQMDASLKNFLTPGNSCRIKMAGKRMKFYVTFVDGHQENLTNVATFSSTDFTLDGDKITSTDVTEGTVNVEFADFFGNLHRVNVNVSLDATGLGKAFTSVNSLIGNTFVIVNEELGKAFYGSTMQNLAFDIYDKAFDESNAGYMFTLESLANDADADVHNYYRIKMLKPDGSDYSVYGSIGYLNSQPVYQWCSFILGLAKGNGQDMKNGAVWDLQYVDGKGFSLKNIGTGLYLKDNTPAKYDTPTYFSLCALPGTAGVERVKVSEVKADDQIYTLSGCKVEGRHLAPGVYINNNKKFVVR